MAVLADESDELKRRGLYVDIDRKGRISAPSEVTWDDLSPELDRAQKAVDSAAILLLPEGSKRLEYPTPDMTSLAVALVDAVRESAGGPRGPEDAVDVLLDALHRLC